MSIFDLLFLVAMLALLVALGLSAFNAIRGRRHHAKIILARVGAVALVYFAVLVAVSIRTPQRTIRPGVAQCFDDWCITVAVVDHWADTIRVQLRLSSRARGISQGERDVRAYVVTGDGRRYEPDADAAAVPLSVTIPPMGSVTVTRTFAVPATAGDPVLVVAHDWFPHCCIIGDRESLLHRPTVVVLR